MRRAPETFELFDDVLLMAEGFIVYHGPVGQVLDFFASMGFQCPERKGVADFLQEVVSKNDQQVSQLLCTAAPRTAHCDIVVAISLIFTPPLCAFMGYQCPERKGVAEFLQEVMSNRHQQASPPVFLHADVWHSCRSICLAWMSFLSCPRRAWGKDCGSTGIFTYIQ